MLDPFPDTIAYRTGLPAGMPDREQRRPVSLALLAGGLLVALCVLFLSIGDALAAGVAGHAPRMDLDLVRTTAERFLAEETASQGEARITVAAPDARLDLAACDHLEGFLPPGARLQGHATVGVRCTAPVRWVLYLSAQVQMIGQYVVAARPLAAGQSLALDDLAIRRGDLADLPTGSLNTLEAALGRQLQAGVSAGQPLRRDALKPVQVVQSGQPVRLHVEGRGFEVTGEGTAVSAATEGAPVQVRTPRGNVISGIARAGGVVDVRI